MRNAWLRKGLWVLGGLALGGLAAGVVGVLVFWVHPALVNARRPFGEHAKPPLTLGYLKHSPVAGQIRALAEAVRTEWQAVLESLHIHNEPFPSPLYVYVYASLDELGLGISARLEEDRAQVASVDVLLPEGLRADLGRLACALAFGRPGNAVVPRGVARYVENPGHPWAEEAWVWSDRLALQDLWSRADRLLPKDPREDLYFGLNAPWVSASTTLEKMRTILTAFSEPRPGGHRAAEAMSAALVEWVLSRFGREGLKNLWGATGLEQAARALRKDPDELTRAFRVYLQERFEVSPHKDYVLALKELHVGRAERVLLLLSQEDDPEAPLTAGLAHLALGDIAQASALLGDPILEKLASAPSVREGPVVIVGDTPSLTPWAQKAHAVLNRAATLWPELWERLPDRLAFYVSAEVPPRAYPWGVGWVRSPEEVPARTAHLVFEAVSPWGLPTFRTLVEGVALWLLHPERDFRGEAHAFVESGRWVPLWQPLFGVYPQELAEAEAGALACFILARFGPEKFRALWAKISEGTSPFRASEDALGVSLYELEAQLLTWIRQP